MNKQQHNDIITRSDRLRKWRVEEWELAHPDAPHEPEWIRLWKYERNFGITRNVKPTSHEEKSKHRRELEMQLNKMIADFERTEHGTKD